MNAAMAPSAMRLRVTWIVLLAATLFGVSTAWMTGHHAIAGAAIMIVAGAKVALILHNFMELGEGPRAFRMYFAAWVVVCVGVITALF